MSLKLNDIAFYRGLKNIDYIYPILASKLASGIEFTIDDTQLSKSLSDHVWSKLEDEKLDVYVSEALELLSSEGPIVDCDINDLADQLVDNGARVMHHYFNLYKFGRNIFCINESLWDLLSHTDLFDEPFDFSTYPYKSFYLHFDKSTLPFDQMEGTSRTNGTFLTGAFVTIYATQVDFMFCSDLTFANKYWFAEPFHVSEIITLILDKSLSPLDLIKRNLDFIATKYEEYGMIRNDDQALHLTKVMDRKFAFYSKSISTIINVMLYLTSDSNHTERDTTNIPPARLANFLKLKKTDKPRAELDLDRIGLIRFNRSGYNLKGNASMTTPSNDGIGKRAHWRRGFWRNQAIGPRSAPQHKLKWIMPTIVGGENGEFPVGHTYDV